jgi:predicted DNA-binding transcriptional regulator AlpA
MNNFDLDSVLKNPEVLIRVLSKPEARRAANLSDRTWDRMEARGETPPKTQLSDNRIGYRMIDIIKWLDARRREHGGRAA